MTKETRTILYPVFFILLLFLTLLQTSGQQRRAKRFLKRKISNLESLINNKKRTKKQFSSYAHIIVELNFMLSEGYKNELIKFLEETRVSDCFLPPLKESIPGDQTLIDLIGDDFEFISSHPKSSQAYSERLNTIYLKLENAEKNILLSWESILQQKIRTLSECV